MNQKQTKILLKLLPKILLLALIVGGILTYLYLSFVLPKQNKEMLNDPKVKQVLQEYNNNNERRVDLVLFNGIYEFELPPELKLRDKVIKNRFEKTKTTTVVNSNKLFLEPLKKGYAEVLIDYKKKNYKIDNSFYDSFSKKDIEDLGEQFYSIYHSREKFIDGFKIIEKYPVEIISINGKNCIRGSFFSQMDKEPMIFTQIYNFYGGYNTVQMTMNYRVEDESKWGKPFYRLIESFKFLK